MKENLKCRPDSAKGIISLKMDEIASEDRLRWNKNDNKIYGICYQHGYSFPMDFESMDNLYQLRELLESGSIHRTKENLVVA